MVGGGGGSDMHLSSSSTAPSVVATPTTFRSHGMDDDALEAQRSPSPSSLRSSPMNSRDSLLSSRLTSSPAFGFRNAYFQVGDLGVYLSRAAIAVVTGVVAIVGIILLMVVVTLAVKLGICRKQSRVNFCASILLNTEINNLQGSVLPPECSRFVARYVQSGQYYVDFAVAVETARQYLNTYQVHKDGRDLVVLDIDETSLSNMPYYAHHHYGVEAWNAQSWSVWVSSAVAPAFDPMLSLYTDLRAQNWSVAFITGRPESLGPKTALNLHNAGYTDWTTLILRSPEEEKLSAVQYKSKYRRRLANQGYRIRSSLGDQWSDLKGGNSGERTFKMPNPMYYIY